MRRSLYFLMLLALTLLGLIGVYFLDHYNYAMVRALGILMAIELVLHIAFTGIGD